ncbi:MAG: DUF262 domain-containing protein [Cryomorphaceae bacterium]|nr:DUF262 domain-containing protein [Cryomorphaceae bacterium]
MKKIDGTPKSIRELFTGVKYTIHYYQREYQWQTKQIEELLSDLTEEFFEFYSEADERSKVLDYGHYFMGSIVLTNEENAIIDGQQRLTSLTLLLIYLYHQLEDEEERAEVLQLIYSKKAGTKTYNIHVPEMPERFDVMNALLQKEYMDVSKHSETIKNIYNRFYDIEAIMNDTLPKNTIEMFKDWLIDNVDFIRIVAQTEQDAHKIFVSMNDRGLSLTPTEMLKGYLLSKIENDSIRQQANDLWKKRILDLKGLGKEEESDFIKNWIRSQYAETIRERKKNASPGDFDIIGTAFHKWIREHSSQMKLLRSKDYEDFVLKQFDKFSHIYLDLKNYSTNYTPGFESVFYNGNRNFTLQFQLILASIDPNETKEESDKKIKLISCFLDLYFTRRIFNYKTVDYSAIVYNVFLLSKKFRRKSIVELLEICKEEIGEMEFQLETIDDFRLNGWTVRYMLHILSRITDFIETSSGLPSNFTNYISREIKNPYDIEHIICDHHDWFEEEYPEKETFDRHRNKFGGLLLLPMDKNRSLNDLTFDKKLPIYFGENLLAKSLNKDCYINNPQFIRFYERDNLDFKPYSLFNKEALLERQELYEEIAKKIWGVEQLDKQIT